MRLFRRSQSEFEEEIRTHLDIEADQLVAEGLSPAEAERAARRKFGNVTLAQERYYDANRFAWFEDLRTDARYALRLARHHPGFSVNVITTAALGIATCVSTFSLVSGILLSPLSFPEQDRVFSLELRSTEGPSAAIPASTFRTLDTSRVFDGVAASEPGDGILEMNGERTPTNTGVVTPSFFRVYRAVPAIGRFFDHHDVVSKAAVVVLTHELWRTRFGADSGIVGRSIVIDDVPRTVVGVAPAGFLGNFEGFQSRPELWTPKVDSPTEDVNLTMRLANGVSRAEADAYLSRVARSRIPSYQRRDSIAAEPELVPVAEMIYGDMRKPLLILLGAVGLVLLLVMANVATMFLARSVTRQAELGVRGALGASRGRQLRQLLTEAMTLTTIAGLIGLAAAAAIIQIVRAVGSDVLSRIDHVGLDWRVLAFAASAVCVTGAVGGVAHHLVSRRSLRQDGNTRITGSQISTLLVVAQVALALTLLVGAGLLVKGFNRVIPKAPGFVTANRVVLEVSLASDPALAQDKRASMQTILDLLSRLDGTAGVERVAMVSFVPLRGNVSIAEVDLPEAPATAARRPAYSNIITPNYFDVMGIPLKAGRKFDATDEEGSTPVAIINDSAAARWWPGLDPIGRQIVAGRRMKRRTYTIVGVVGGSRMSGRNRKRPPELFWPLAQNAPGWASFVVATRGSPTAMMPSLRRVVHDVAPRVPIMYASDYESLAMRSVRTPRFYSIAMSVFAAAAIALSTLGVYGLLAFAVVQRRREIGIRMALGATAGRIGATVVGRAMSIGAAGVAVGLLAAFGLSRFLGSLLVEVTPTDRAVFVVCGIVGLVVAGLAGSVPAYNATHTDPMRSLRA